MRSLIFIFISFSILGYAQKKQLRHPMDPITTPISSHWIMITEENGKLKYISILNNKFIDGKVIINETKLNTRTDIVNSYYNTGYEFIGTFNKGYKNGLWKTTYKNKLVKTINYNNGLVVGRYRVYNTKGKLLYKTTFGKEGNGRYEDYYYKTGVLKQEGDYKNGKRQGEWCDYNKNGELIKSTIYNKGMPQ